MKNIQTVLVTKNTKQKKEAKIGKKSFLFLSGEDAYLTSSHKSSVQVIVCWYLSGKCKTASGDVWEVVKCPNSSADFIAIA